MSVIDDYLNTLSGEEKSIVEHMYSVVRHVVPDATEEVSYAMPVFKYKGKGSVHFSVDNPISDDLLRSIITARMQQIDA